MEPDQCSDEKLREAILTRLAGDDRTTSANLRVGVMNGVAHLAGVVSSLDVYIVAAEITESVRGVRGVVNRIEAPGAPSPSRRIDLTLGAVTDSEKEVLLNDEITFNPSTQEKGESK